VVDLGTFPYRQTLHCVSHGEVLRGQRAIGQDLFVVVMSVSPFSIEHRCNGIQLSRFPSLPLSLLLRWVVFFLALRQLQGFTNAGSNGTRVMLCLQTN